MTAKRPSAMPAAPSVVSEQSRSLQTRQSALHDGSLDAASSGRDSLLRVLRSPDVIRDLTLKDWEVLVPQARFAGIWPQLAAQVRRRGRQTDVPPPVWRQMEAVLRVADVEADRYRWEVNRLQQATADISCPLVLLKGAAFLCSGFPFAEGRSFQDIDMLVPRGELAQVESALLQYGWVDSLQSPLDVMYYRQWLQELAPLWHPEREIQVDLHHSIIPPKDRLRFDPAPLFQDAVPLSGSIYTLSPVDMVLHAASNLFWTGEFTYILSDLYDLHSLLGIFSPSAEFWPRLVSRAAQLNLTAPLYYAVRYLQQVFETPVPPELADTIESWRPGWLSLKVMDILVHRTLFPRSLDEIDETRHLALTFREYWSLPRLDVMFTGVFWLKRLPDWFLVWLGLRIPESAEPAPRNFMLP